MIERVIAWLLVYNRVISWPLVVGALIFCLYHVVPGWPVWTWCSLAVAVIFVFEMGFWLQQRNKEVSRKLAAQRQMCLRGSPAAEGVEFELETARVESDQLKRNTAQSLIGVALLLASAFGLVLAVHSKPATSTDFNQTSIHLSDRTENHLPTDGKTSAPGSNETTIAFHHDLEQALSDYLKKPPSPDQGISWPLAFLIGVVAVVVGWIVTHRPSAAPVVGAGGVAEEVVRNFKHLSRPGGGYSWDRSPCFSESDFSSYWQVSSKSSAPARRIREVLLREVLQVRRMRRGLRSCGRGLKPASRDAL